MFGRSCRQSSCQHAKRSSRSLNWFERWFLKRVCRKLVIQGPTHDKRIESYYRIMHRAARAEFREDTGIALNGFLEECHKAASK